MTVFQFGAGHLFLPVVEENLVVSQHQHNANQINTGYH